MLLRQFTNRGLPARIATLAAGALLLAALTVLTWYAWLGWDHEYQIDPVTGVASGPYEANQVIGCVLTLLGLALAAGVLVHPWVPLAVMPLAFTVAWSVDAAGEDETGLWGVGAIMLLVGLSAGAAVLAGLSTLVLRWLFPPRLLRHTM